ncbi:MAG: hypothetical protein ACYS7M_02390 [Planctomycetota bacterium]
MSTIRPGSCGVFVLIALITVAAAYGPVAQILLAQEAARAAAEAAREQQRHRSEDTNRDDASGKDPAVIIVPHCEWDRVAKSSSPPAPLRILPLVNAATPSSHHRPRCEVARHSPSSSAILATNGTLLNHAPHAPPRVGCAQPTTNVA